MRLAAALRPTLPAVLPSPTQEIVLRWLLEWRQFGGVQALLATALRLAGAAPPP